MPTCPSPRCTESSNPPYVSVKIPALFADPKNEMDKLHLIQNANPSHEGYSFIHTPLDHFDLSGPEGTHTCLVYEPMRETLSQYQRRFPRRIDVPIFKLHIYLILRGTITNPRGRECATINELWGGHFFDEIGRFNNSIPTTYMKRH